MKLIQSLIESKIKFAEDDALRKWYKKEMWNYCRAYTFALEYLGIKDKDPSMKNLLLKKFLLDPKSLGSKYYLILSEITSRQMETINQALDKIIQSKEESGYVENQIFKHSFGFAPFAVYAYQINEEI